MDGNYALWFWLELFTELSYSSLLSPDSFSREKLKPTKIFSHVQAWMYVTLWCLKFVLIFLYIYKPRPTIFGFLGFIAKICIFLSSVYHISISIWIKIKLCAHVHRQKYLPGRKKKLSLFFCRYQWSSKDAARICQSEKNYSTLYFG